LILTTGETIKGDMIIFVLLKNHSLGETKNGMDDRKPGDK
jgi:hypothetical protein